MFSLHLVEELSYKEPEHKPFKKMATLPEIFDNESIQSFLQDSLLFTPPRIQPLIVTRLSPLHPKIIGLTTEITQGVYLIQLNGIYSSETLQRTLFHELIHVYQFERDLLQEMGRFIVWKNVIFSWSVPWDKRPWEIHAEMMTEQLFVPDKKDF